MRKNIHDEHATEWGGSRMETGAERYDVNEDRVRVEVILMDTMSRGTETPRGRKVLL